MGLAKYTPRKLKTVILAGQSNESGSAIGTQTATYAGYHNNYIFYKPDATSTNNGAFQCFKFGSNNACVAGDLSKGCPATTLSYQFYQDTKEPLLIIKYAYGGSCLVDDGSVYTNGLWQIDANATNANNLVHYNILMNNFVIPAIQLAQSKHIELDFVSMFWCQGEGDSDSPTAYRSQHYEAELIRLFDSVKTTLQAQGVMNAGFKPIISRIHNNFNPARAYSGAVRTALVNVANHYGSSWIDTDAYPLIADNTHFTMQGQETHGLDRNTALKTLLGL